MKVLAIPDMHHPFAHPQALEFVSGIEKKFKPDRIICLGDEVDAYGQSSYTRSPKAMSAMEERLAAIRELKKWYKRFPKVDVCTSNHLQRPAKRAAEVNLPIEDLLNPHIYLEAPEGWQWNQRWCVDGVYYFHGDGYSGKTAPQRLLADVRASCVIGHLHNTSGMIRLPNFHNDCWAMVAGCLIDFDAYAFDYCRDIVGRPSLGCVTVVDGKVANFHAL